MYHHLGISLIEILISLLILSLMLFGLDVMQFTALREAKAAYYFSVAMQQLKNRIEQLNEGEDSKEQFLIWNQQNHEVLPQGRGEEKGYGLTYEVSIFWGDDHRMQDCDEDKIGQSGCLHVIVTPSKKADLPYLK